MRRHVVGILGSGRDEHRALAEPLARWVARSGYHLLTGAGEGVMGAAARAFVEVPGRAGLSLGIVPGAWDGSAWRPRPGYPHPAVELAVMTHLPLSGAQGMEPLSRNHVNVLTAHALVALPGGAGTLSEARLALRYQRPLILHGPQEAFTPFPPGLERTPSLERVCAFLREALGEAPGGG